MEDDNSPISGLNALGEYPVIFKNDSIWQMVFTGLDVNNLTTWAPIRTVAGIGCVSNSSIKQVRGRLIFLAEDGIYAFNGTPQAKKITEDPATGADRLRDFMQTVTPGRRPYAAAAHWRKHSMYLLAISVNGSDANNRVVAWDYLHDTWWIWDGIEAQVWLEDEDASDDERLYFGDASGRIYEFGVGNNDHGTAISSYIVTHRIGYRDNIRKRLHQVEVTSDSKTRDITCAVYPNDRTLSASSGSISLTDVNQKDWSSFSWPSGGGDNWAENVRRPRRLSYKQDGDWFQLKLSHSTKDQPMRLANIQLGYHPLGRR